MTISQTAEIIAEILHGVSFGGRTEEVSWRARRFAGRASPRLKITSWPEQSCGIAAQLMDQVPSKLICSFSYPCSRAHKSNGIVASSSTTATANPVLVKSILFR
jgi:hypothetical protein